MAFRSAASFKYPPRLVVSSDGGPDSGKTHFMLTAPRPLFILNVDYGLEGVMDSSRFNLDRVEVADYRLDKAMLTSKMAQAAMARVAQQFVADYRSLLATHKQRITIGLDTATEFWEIFRLADLGKLEQVPPMRYTRVNRLFKDLINEVYRTPHNLVLLHHTKDKYESRLTDEGKEVSVRVPGEIERMGFKGVEAAMQVVLAATRIKKPGKSPKYGFEVAKCRQRPAVEGERFEGQFATFASLATSVYPDTDEDDWGGDDVFASDEGDD
jgi:hypothetical protein